MHDTVRQSGSVRRIVALDTETTGFGAGHRVLAFAAVRVDEAATLQPAQRGSRQAELINLVFDPQRNSDARARDVHGWDDWTLRHQDTFATWAPAIHTFLAEADLVVAHNAAFDMDMLGREFERCGLPAIGTAVECTMALHRSCFPRMSARLDDCLARLGVQRSAAVHNAVEDAFLAMRLWFDLAHEHDIGALRAIPPPSNLRECPPRPDGPLPRRARKGSALTGD